MAAISADRLACRKQEIRRRARLDLDAHGVLRADRRLDLARLLERPPLLWRVADHLLDLLPGEIRTSVEIVAGFGTGGLLLGHVMSALLDGRRPLASPPVRFAMFETTAAGGPRIEAGAAAIVRGQDLLIVAAEASAEDRRGCLHLARAAGARVLAFAAIGGEAGTARDTRDARDPPAWLLCEDLRAGGPHERGIAWCAEDA